ncbi:L,D-transpeptidase [Nodularia sphaerocarpa]|uniref:L,D-transpeptidase n=1 Tax=Nodularia sphaerocarpa TaxID=137816 RepID=UPI001EFC2422|nr:L,D-transpeptidase [Nodularia sphaerocarpa]MDB9372261.1 L,D-transpeptidase [Nodularia sphaerocarpa CS-585]MDB9378256.1 L,D-transpeptidase [Nodularia sphaerocarpa CS-585A2]ULP74570.1 putative L,D-transpeptidase YnhG [Nodularia sphaerocarpa UHCC 0038]
MVRNESVARIVMFLCFGTAILSLAVHWRMTTTQGSFEQPASAAGSRSEVADGGLGKTVPGASIAPVQPTHQPDIQKSAVPRLSVALSTNSAGSNQLRSLFSRQRQNSPDLSSQTSSQTEVVVNLSDRRTYVYKKGEVIASYPIAIGKEGWETPTGSFRVTDMQQYPIWQHPITDKVFPSGADSPLGERWIGFWSDGRNEIGFHGTPDTHLLGAAISHGCLRMRNDDVRLLYEQVNIGTLVSVRD